MGDASALVLPFVSIERKEPVRDRVPANPLSLSDIVVMWHAAREIGCIKGEQQALAKGDEFRIARYGQ